MKIKKYKLFVENDNEYNIKEIPTITHGLSKCPTKIRKK